MRDRLDVIVAEMTEQQHRLQHNIVALEQENAMHRQNNANSEVRPHFTDCVVC